MGQILKNWRIFSAFTVALVLIVGSFMLAQGMQFPARVQASTESELLQAIATKDTDGDGLTDWEEALYGTDPRLTDTRSLGMTDGEAVAKGLIVPKAIENTSIIGSSVVEADENGLPPAPREGTLTDAFTKTFLSYYLAARQAKGGADLSDADLQTVASDSISALSSLVVLAPDFKSKEDLTITDTGIEALKAYAVEIEAVFSQNNAADASRTEIAYLKDAIENGNSAVFAPIASLAKSYRETAVGLAALAVPKNLAEGHLALINALMRKSEVASDFVRLNDDPLATIVALEQYPQVLEALGAAFMRIGEVYAASSVGIPPRAPGSYFLSLVGGFIANQQAAKLQL